MNFKKFSTLALGVSAALASYLAQAEQPSQAVERLTVTGTHLADQTAPARIAKVTINAEQIKALAPNTFVDVLRGVPGVDISEQGGAGGLTFLSIRGGDPNFVTVIIDGVKVNDPTNSRGGAFDFGTLDPATVAKVEVFYGSYSTVYGSDALSGVISIETQSAATAQSNTVLTVKGGSGSMLGGNAYTSATIADKAQVSLTVGHQNKDNSTFGDDFKRTQINGAVSSVGNTDTQWRVAAFYADGEAAYFPEDSGGDRLAVIRDAETRDYEQTNVGAQLHHHINEQLSIKADTQWANRKEKTDNPGIAPGVYDPVPAMTGDSDFDRYEATLTANYLFSPILTLAAGTSWIKEEGGMDSVIDFGFPMPANYYLERKTNSVFAEVGFKPIQDLYFMAGIRHDDAEENSVTTNRFLAQYQLTEALSVSGLYSEGFKLPGFFAIAHPLVGNPELNPEHSENYELSVDFAPQTKPYSARLSWYRNTYEDLVDFDPEQFINVNRSKFEARGVELSGDYQVSERWQLMAQASYNEIDTYDPEVKQRRAPEWKASVTTSYQASEQLALTGRWAINDDYYDSSVPTGLIELDGYDRLDVGASWQATKALVLRANAKNLLDDDSEESVGFDNGGREFTVSASYQF